MPNSYPTDYRYHTTLSKEKCDEYNLNFIQGDIRNGRPVHLDSEIIENWYPKTFAERVDDILLCIYSNTGHIGEETSFNYSEILSLLFVDRKEADHNPMSETRGQMIPRDARTLIHEAKYMLSFMKEKQLIEYSIINLNSPTYIVLIAPLGYSRIDELQKYSTFGKAALVAMKFGDDTIPLREAIRQGINDAGYNAVFIDEVQHNEFITPELLKHIRDSKFVVVDLTHQNNGAYFEEGYAMGLGKPVIQLCKKATKLHFDIAQKNTIIWEVEDEIPARLTNRIKATID